MEPVRVREEESKENSVTKTGVIPTTSEDVMNKRSEAVSMMHLNQSMASLSINHNVMNIKSAEDYLLPTIHRGILEELDFSRLERNAQIMHDLYLESNLRIQPNKQVRSECEDAQYWLLVEEDLRALTASIGVGKRGKCSLRLRKLLEEIKFITQEMHSKSDRVQTELRDYFDTDSLISAMECGRFDLTLFGPAFTDLLQANCAPKRDPLIVKLRQYAITENVIAFLRQTLILLEIMKIDLVNYHLAKIRTSIGGKLEILERDQWITARLGVDSTRAWLSKSFTSLGISSVTDEAVYSAFLDASVKLALGLDTELNVLPETFYLDEKRIMSMRTQSQDICIVSLILNILRQCIKNKGLEGLLKNELFVKLDQEHVEVSELAACTVCLIEQHYGSIPEAMRKTLLGTVNNLVDPDSNAYKIVEERMAKYLIGRLTRPVPMPNCLSALSEEVDELCGAIVAMCHTNWTVHKETYRELLAKQ